MPSTISNTLAIWLCSLYLTCYPPAHAQYFRSAKVEHLSPTMARISVNDPRPMRQVVQGLRRTYGLLISYEDPPYFSSYDVVDAANSTWRAKHPGSKPYLGIAGGPFTSEFPEISEAQQDSSAKAALVKITADYDQSTNPGRFAVRVEGPHRFSVVGTFLRAQDGRQKALHALLDTYVSIRALRAATAEDLLNALCEQLTKLTGETIIPGTNPVNMMTGTRVTLNSSSGPEITARRALMEISAAARYSLVWTLNWDPNERFYVLNLTTAMKVEMAPDGTLKAVPLKLD